MDNSIKNLRESFKKIIDSLGSETYIDFNYLNSSETRISVDKENVEISKDSDKGVKIRVYDGEKFIEYGTTSLSYDSLLDASKELLNQAKVNRENIANFTELNITKEELEKDFIVSVDESSKSLEQKTNELKALKNDLIKLDSDIVNVRSALIEEEEEHIFVNKYRNLYEKIPIKILVAVVMVKCEDGEIRSVYESFTDNDNNVFDKLNHSLEKFKSLISKVKKAKKLEGGKYKVILTPRLSGLLAHESFGHGMEADTMMKDRALATELVGQKVAGSNVNIVDYPAISGKHGEFYFDCDGVVAREVYLVKNGIVNEPMADSYSKTRMNLKNSSNSRMESFDHKNYTRMSNTYFQSGVDKFDEMLKSVEDGILVTDSSGGMEDPKGWGVQLQGCFGQRIKNGVLIDEYYDGFAITGFLPDILNNISAISDDFLIEGAGNCGKGHKEWVRVAEGGPYMLIDEIILG